MASIISGYNYDIFISYRQKDNKYDGWVSEFVENLKRELESMFKDEVSVYFDINPSDYLLETHDVDASLKEKLKCLVFIPIISRTYCDPKSFAWDNELKVFVNNASGDQFGFKVKLPNGNVANRVLPIRIHDIDNADTKLFESVVGGVLRSIDFVYKETGVNRQLRAKDDDIIKSPGHILYRDQINKVALAIKDIIESMRVYISSDQAEHRENQEKASEEKKKTRVEELDDKEIIKSKQKFQVLASKPVKRKKILRIIIGSGIALSFMIISLIIFKFYKRQYARNNLIPEIQKLIDDNYDAPYLAFELAMEADKYIHKDSSLIQLWQKISQTISLQTLPEGATVSWKEYNQPTDPWNEAGVTPFENIRIPLGYKRIKIEKNGFQPVLITNFNLLDLNNSLKLDSIGALPPNMVRIPAQITAMRIVGLEKIEERRMEEFLVDRFEVRNSDYKRFVDAGGYSKKSYWNFPIYKDGKEISWETAMSMFIDKTGKQGPANWVVGTYPDGEEDFPVTGISWYEASSYAAYMGKRLPTLYHWSIIAEIEHSADIIPLSNMDGNSIMPVGTMDGISSYGIYDLAGNVREWCYNGNGIKGETYILGGGWNDPEFSFYEAGTQPSIDRSLSNGFRCIMELTDDTTFNSLSGPIILEFRDYRKEKPVDEKTFNVFLRQYDYDKIPLNEQILTTADSGIWKVEKVEVDAAYNNERLIIYLFIPRDHQPPYQPIIIFPGSSAIQRNLFNSTYIQGQSFIVKSGRVLVFPILKGTYERKDELNKSPAEETVFYKDHVIMWRKDIGRTIDYLETRGDLLHNSIGYFGFSWGGRMGGIYPAVERRIKAVVLHVGGMGMNKTFPEVDPLNFLPRIYQPVLMLNGKYDMDFPVETSQIPMFNLLGTPEADKVILTYNSGHLVPYADLMKETLTWFDKYLGPVK